MDKLIKIQQKLKAPKGQYNKFGNFHYRSAEDILEAVKPLLDGALLTLQDEAVMLGNRYYIKATVTFIDENFKTEITAYAREPETKAGMDASQITGTASSYARKYALNGLFCIDDNKDADTEEYVTEVKVKEAIEKQKQEEKHLGLQDYLALIKACKTENEVNKLFYEWSKIYTKGTTDYLPLSNASFEQKKLIKEK